MTQISEALLAALNSDCAHDLEPIVQAKTAADFEALRGLLSMDQAINPRHRKKAIFLLGRWGDPSAVADILKILPHLDEIERARAIDSLGRLGTPQAVQAILDHADDPSPSVRKFVTHALGRIDSPEAQATLQHMQTSDPADFVRTQAEKYLK